MYELIKNPNIDWLGLKRPFIMLSIALLVAGMISVIIQGFNLGVDFSGGVLANVKFRGERPSENQIRDALNKQGIDTGKVVIQPVSDPITGGNNQMLIRLPQHQSPATTSMKPSVGEVVAATMQGAAPAKATPPSATPQAGSSTPQPTGTTPPATGAQQQPPATSETSVPVVTPTVPPATSSASPTDQQPERIGEEKRAILAALESFNDQADVSGKTDLNTVGRESLRNKLIETDPLGMNASGQSAAAAEYTKYADLMIDYRDKQSGGLINQISDLKNVSGFSSALADALPNKFFAGNVALTGYEEVGPQISGELQQRAIYVTLASFVGILLYMAFRFEWIYGVAAVVAVCHDLLVTLGIFSILKEEISLNVVAALLTLAGYSVNDTIVIFDRIRENLKLRRKDSLPQLVNDSINQTLSRTILVSGLTFLAVLALLIWGGPVLHGLALALTIGIVVGSYSTLAIASPIMVWWQQRKELRARGQREFGAAKRDMKRKMVAS
jgi:preprotein translocase subunit SecF